MAFREERRWPLNVAAGQTAPAQRSGFEFDPKRSGKGDKRFFQNSFGGIELVAVLAQGLRSIRAFFARPRIARLSPLCLSG